MHAWPRSSRGSPIENGAQSQSASRTARDEHKAAMRGRYTALSPSSPIGLTCFEEARRMTLRCIPTESSGLELYIPRGPCVPENLLDITPELRFCTSTSENLLASSTALSVSSHGTTRGSTSGLSRVRFGKRPTITALTDFLQDLPRSLEGNKRVHSRRQAKRPDRRSASSTCSLPTAGLWLRV